jgi:hypothetical protein
MKNSGEIDLVYVDGKRFAALEVAGKINEYLTWAFAGGWRAG